MSTPRNLALPTGVERAEVGTTRGPFAAHVVRGGSRGHVLLIPGWTGSKEDFTPLLPFLADAGFDATAYDQRGQYETPGTETDDYSLEGLARDAAAVAAAVEPGGSHLLGHSFGGLVAQQAVVDRREAWGSLSLLCSGPGTLGESPQRRLGDLVAALDSDLPMTQIARDLKGDSSDLPPEIAAFVTEKFERTARWSLAAMTRHLIDSPDLTDAITDLAIPVWVARGVDDQSWPHEAQDDQARRLGTTTTVVPESAHSPAIENPQGLADRWLPFLSGTTR